uniref:NS5-like protein n=1 Tax=Cryptocercus pudacuoensis jingmenvirus TaxID=3133548 RepID=A0AAT9JFU7_9FLAV
MMLLAIFAALFIWLYCYYELGVKVGCNRIGMTEKLEQFSRKVTTSPFDTIKYVYKALINGMTKKEFDEFKTRGIVSRKKLLHEVSRGVMKLQDLLRQTRLKPGGIILSLACGRGGWEQELSPVPLVKSIIAMTFGRSSSTPGHEDFSDRLWPGKEKISLINTDIRKMVGKINKTYNWLLFDGGEENANPEKEADKIYDLLKSGVEPYVYEGLEGFIIKILTPFDARIVELLERIRSITGKGNLYVSMHTRQSTSEMYFCSTPIGGDLKRQVRELTEAKIKRAIFEEQPILKERYVRDAHFRQKIYEDVRLLKPIDMSRSIFQLGPKVFDQPRAFLHWFSEGTYPFGSRGGKSTMRCQIVWDVVRSLITNMPGLSMWTGTDTTPEGFMNVFSRKVDRGPVENSPYFVRLREVYHGMANHFRSRGFKLRSLTMDEVRERANKKGAPGPCDRWMNLGEALTDPSIEKRMADFEDGLSKGQPVDAIFSTMGKREKKKDGNRGSRMVAFLPIVARMVELKRFGSLLELTKPYMNRFGVGGLGLHDLGQRAKSVFKQWAVSDDIAGFDTRVGLKVLSMEFYDFISLLGPEKMDMRVAEGLYRIYAHPHILIPKPGRFVRSELLSGIGQRMSGTGPTYAMNTITRIALMMLQMAEVETIGIGQLSQWVTNLMANDERWSGCVSGDDAFFTGSPDDITRLSKMVEPLNSMGFYRKDMPLNADGLIAKSMEEVEFCSHRYEEVTYYDEMTDRTVTRYQPVRSYGEIFAKASIWMSGSEFTDNQQAWASAQANNLFINYGHMRDCRRLALVIKSVVRPDILLVGFHKAGFMPRPWMQPGELLDVSNRCLFGESTAYPVPGFSVRRISHMGYIKLNREKIYNQQFGSQTMIGWRNGIKQMVDKLRFRYGGNGEAIHNMSIYRPIGL